MMTPKAIRVMAAYFEASERLADATQDLVNANNMRRSGLIGSTTQFEEVAHMRLAVYRQARAEYEAL